MFWKKFNIWELFRFCYVIKKKGGGYRKLFLFCIYWSIVSSVSYQQWYQKNFRRKKPGPQMYVDMQSIAFRIQLLTQCVCQWCHGLQASHSINQSVSSHSAFEQRFPSLSVWGRAVDRLQNWKIYMQSTKNSHRTHTRTHTGTDLYAVGGVSVSAASPAVL